MKNIISECDFHDAFINIGRENSFSYAGRKALFEYIEEYEESCGTEVELDPIALCCEFNEYADVAEFLGEYDSYQEAWDECLADADNDEDDARKAFLERLQDETTVIDVDGTGFIIAAF